MEKLIHDGDIRDQMVDGDIGFILGNWPNMTPIQKDYINSHAMECGFLPIGEDASFRFDASNTYSFLRGEDRYSSKDCLEAHHLSGLTDRIVLYIGCVWVVEHAAIAGDGINSATLDFMDEIVFFLRHGSRPRLRKYYNGLTKPAEHMRLAIVSAYKHDGHCKKHVAASGMSAAMSARRTSGVCKHIDEWKEKQLKRAADVCLSVAKTGMHIVWTNVRDFLRESMRGEA